jgi:choline dehydrogenase-like flavoprotein
LNPFDETPVIEPEFSSNPLNEKISERDLNTFLWSIRQIRGFLQTKKLSRLVKSEILPGQNQSETNLAIWVRFSLLLLFSFRLFLKITRYQFLMGNMVGSMKMGTNAVDSPVDENFRLRGFKGLSIVGKMSFLILIIVFYCLLDASVIPQASGGNILTTVVALASIAADVLLSDKN